jgi:hypothetical protein
MKDNGTKQNVLNNFLQVLFGISNKRHQERVWIRGEGPECDDFTETVCFFFEIGDFILEDYKSYGISKEQFILLKQFRYDFEQFSDKNSWAADFIDTPEWAEIMTKANNVLKAFNFQKNS